MAFRATTSAAIQADDDTTAALDNATATVRHRVSHTATLTPSTTPPGTKAWSDTAQLTAGAATVNLAALPTVAGASLDLTGLKVQTFIIKAASTNTNTLRIEAGATNGYNIFGSADGATTIPADGSVHIYAPEGLPDVASGARTIDLSSSDTDAEYTIELVAG